MFYSKIENKYVKEGSQFELGGVTYPPQWLYQATPEQKSAIGLEEVIVTNMRKSDRYYYVSEKLEGATLTYENIPIDLDTIKSSCLAQVNYSAYNLLLPSDYMAGKAFETGTQIPTEWAEWRQSIRQVARSTAELINSAVNVDEIETIMNNVVWPSSPNANVL